MARIIRTSAIVAALFVVGVGLNAAAVSDERQVGVHVYHTASRTGVFVGNCYDFSFGVDTQNGIYRDAC